MLGHLNQVLKAPGPLLCVGQVENKPTEVESSFVEVIEEPCDVWSPFLTVLFRPGIGNQFPVRKE